MQRRYRPAIPRPAGTASAPGWYAIGTVAVLFGVAGLITASPAARADTFPPLGFRPLPAHVAVEKMMAPPNPFPMSTSQFDWRSKDIIPEAQHQGDCGACWVFAGVACMEAMCRQAGAPSSLDLSEQHVLSCATMGFFHRGSRVRNRGCCGGSATVFEFLRVYGSMLEGDLPYEAGDSGGGAGCGMNVPVVPCAQEPSSGWYVSDWHLIAGPTLPTVEELKSALAHGPIWLGYNVYEDFGDYWYGASPGDPPYRHETGALVGGHAVLLIGFDDEEQSFTCLNSWGRYAGPYGDGTFRVAYDHSTEFGQDAAWIEVDQGVYDPGPDHACCNPNTGGCIVVSEDECEALMGIWQPHENACTPLLCQVEHIDAPCCLESVCVWRNEDECLMAGGTWESQAGSCDPNPCADPPGSGLAACCQGPDCFLATEAECESEQGDWMPASPACDPNPCPSPSERLTWGAIKIRYRASLSAER